MTLTRCGVKTRHPSTLEVEIGRSGIQGIPGKFKASMSYTRPCVKTTRTGVIGSYTWVESHGHLARKHFLLWELTKDETDNSTRNLLITQGIQCWTWEEAQCTILWKVNIFHCRCLFLYPSGLITESVPTTITYVGLFLYCHFQHHSP